MASALSASKTFPFGRLMKTQGVDTLIQQGQLDPRAYVFRHLNGDWGDLCRADWLVNDAALKSGGRLLSSYQVTADLTLWIITEASRTVTMLLLPDEY